MLTGLSSFQPNYKWPPRINRGSKGTEHLNLSTSYIKLQSIHPSETIFCCRKFGFLSTGVWEKPANISPMTKWPKLFSLFTCGLMFILNWNIYCLRIFMSSLFVCNAATSYYSEMIQFPVLKRRSSTSARLVQSVAYCPLSWPLYNIC